jgi:hypothetical protein
MRGLALSSRIARWSGGALVALTAGAVLAGPARDDGAAAAPAGDVSFGDILRNYPVRPDWNIAGVDYNVGTPAGTLLKDPLAIAMAGVAVDKRAHIVTVTHGDVTLSGYDFGAGGGWQVNVIHRDGDVTISNSRFAVGANNLMPIQAYYGGRIRVVTTTFDGGAKQGSSVNAMVFAGSGAHIQYNRFTNFPNDGIDLTRDGDFVIHNNLFDTMGAGDFHTDAIQTFFGAIGSLSIQYNTMYQPPAMINGGINAFVRIGDQEGKAVQNAVAAFNTIIMASTHALTANIFQWSGDGAGALVNPIIHDNYIDPRGLQYAVVAPMLQDSKAVVNPVTYDNIDLNTGKILLSGPYNNRWTSVPRRPPAPPAILREDAAGSDRLQLSGTAPAGLSVAVYAGSRLLGTAKVGRAGAWICTVERSPADPLTLTARATDALTNSSAMSKEWKGAAASKPAQTGAVPTMVPVDPGSLATTRPAPAPVRQRVTQ